MAYQGGQTFRDIDPVVIEKLKLADEFLVLKRDFPDRHEGKFVDKFDMTGAAGLISYIKYDPKDLVDFLICAIKSETPKISLDEEEYILTAQWEGKQSSVTIDILISQVNEKLVAVEFKRSGGDINLYKSKVELIKKLMGLLIVATEEDKKEKSKAPQKEEKEVPEEQKEEKEEEPAEPVEKEQKQEKVAEEVVTK